MAGHSKWANIKHRKGAQDAKRGKVFTKHAKLITIAAKECGGDIDSNPTLRMLIQKARKDNLPNDKIDYAIKVGTGEIKSELEISEIIYEGYAPGGIAILIQALTDNNNRTLASVRTILSKNGGSLGNAGCVSYLFKRKGVFVFEENLKDKIEEFAILNGAEDIKEEEGYIVVYTSLEDYMNFSKVVGESEFEPVSFESSFIPDSTVDVDKPEKAEKILNLLELLEDDDDVQTVNSNLNITC